jgi:addiction module HigA family antidote
MSIGMDEMGGMDFGDIVEAGAEPIAPTHPGEVLLLEWLEPLGLSQYALAKAIAVPPRRINEIVQGKRGVSANTALRLARFFGGDAQFWLNLQDHYDTQRAQTMLKDILPSIQPYADTHQARVG